jgi:hypothetical protein
MGKKSVFQDVFLSIGRILNNLYSINATSAFYRPQDKKLFEVNSCQFIYEFSKSIFYDG